MKEFGGLWTPLNCKVPKREMQSLTSQYSTPRVILPEVNTFLDNAMRALKSHCPLELNVLN